MTGATNVSVRLASRPGPEHQNPYFRLMYTALESLRVRHAGGFPVSDDWLRTHAHEIDALHVHWPEWLWRPEGRSSARWVGGVYRFLRLARRLGVACIWTVHNLLPHEWEFVDLAGLWLLSRETDLFVCHTRETERQITRWLRPPAHSRTVVMPMGNYDGAYPLPSTAMDVRDRFGVPKGKRLIGMIGQIRAYKGIDVALDAIERLDDASHLIIAGRPVGLVKQQLQRAAEARGRVTLIDRDLSDQEVADLLSILDVAWLPYSRITGSSALLLALTAGVPVVASDLAFFRETLRNEPGAGRLFATGDAAALAENTRELLAQPERVRRTAARAVAEQFRWSNCVRPLADAIHATVAERRLLHAG